MNIKSNWKLKTQTHSKQSFTLSNPSKLFLSLSLIISTLLNQISILSPQTIEPLYSISHNWLFSLPWKTFFTWVPGHSTLLVSSYFYCYSFLVLITSPILSDINDKDPQGSKLKSLLSQYSLSRWSHSFTWL